MPSTSIFASALENTIHDPFDGNWCWQAKNVKNSTAISLLLKQLAGGGHRQPWQRVVASGQERYHSDYRHVFPPFFGSDMRRGEGGGASFGCCS